jgi:hypothetical protein
MGEHVVPDAALALMPQRGDIDRRGDDSFARPRRRVGERPAVEIDDLASTGPEYGG